MDYHYPPDISDECSYILSVWRVIDTQWRFAANRLVGIDMVAVKVLLDVYNIKLTPDLIDHIRFIEGKYITAHAEALAQLESKPTKG